MHPKLFLESFDDCIFDRPEEVRSKLKGDGRMDWMDCALIDGQTPIKNVIEGTLTRAAGGCVWQWTCCRCAEEPAQNTTPALSSCSMINILLHWAVYVLVVLCVWQMTRWPALFCRRPPEHLEPLTHATLKALAETKSEAAYTVFFWRIWESIQSVYMMPNIVGRTLQPEYSDVRIEMPCDVWLYWNKSED